MSLAGKIALVTGASRGIGQTVALALGHAGARVVGTATRPAGAEAISAAFAAAGVDGLGVLLDLAQPDSMTAALAAIVAHFGAAPLILVNNAGIREDALLMRMKASAWAEVVDVNLNAVFALTKACVSPMVKARWGRIVNISSVVAFTGNAGQSNYVATKAGLVGFTKSIAIELATRNVTANCVAPGFIETDMTASLTDAQKQGILAQVPMQRMGKPEDIAAAVLYLVSEGAQYVTGATLHINGGMFRA